MQILGSNTNICFPKVLCVGVSLSMSVSVHVTLKVSHHLPSNIFKPCFKWLAKYSNHTGSGDHPRASHLISSFESSPPTDNLSAVHSDILSGILCGNSSWRVPLGARRWGQAVPTELWCSRLRTAVPAELWCSRLWLDSPLRSGARGWGRAVRWDLELAVEVRQCPLRSGARGWGPAAPTEIWSLRLRSGCAHFDLELAGEEVEAEVEDEEAEEGDKI